MRLTWKRRGWASEMRDKPSATWALHQGGGVVGQLQEVAGQLPLQLRASPPGEAPPPHWPPSWGTLCSSHKHYSITATLCQETSTNNCQKSPVLVKEWN